MYLSHEQLNNGCYSNGHASPGQWIPGAAIFDAGLALPQKHAPSNIGCKFQDELINALNEGRRIFQLPTLGQYRLIE
jgi:hypothetical protein